MFYKSDNQEVVYKNSLELSEFSFQGDEGKTPISIILVNKDKPMIDKEILSGKMLKLISFLILLLLSTKIVLGNLCQSDINNDGRVDGSDLMKMKVEMGRENCSSEPCEADINGDGKVNEEDMAIIKGEFNRYDCIPGYEAPPWEQFKIPQMERGAEFTMGEEEEMLFDTDEDEESKEDVELPMTRFKDDENGTVTDPETNLMWTKNADPYEGTVLFNQALAYIEKMNEGEYPNFGYTDWRLPTLYELRSLIDYTKLRKEDNTLFRVHALPLGHPFDNVKSMNFRWGEKTYLYTTDHSWFVSLYCRLIGHNVKSCFGYVWPVREMEESENKSQNSQ